MFRNPYDPSVPSGTNFPLLLQPAPVGSPLQALGLGQEVMFECFFTGTYTFLYI